MVRRPQKAKGSFVQGEELKKAMVALLQFYIGYFEDSFWPKKYYLMEEVYLAGNVFQNSARHECKRILPKSVKT